MRLAKPQEIIQRLKDGEDPEILIESLYGEIEYYKDKCRQYQEMIADLQTRIQIERT